MKSYQNNSPIKRPVLPHPLWWVQDVQALPPCSWCTRCGAEVYRPDNPLCPRCNLRRMNN